MMKNISWIKKFQHRLLNLMKMRLSKFMTLTKVEITRNQKVTLNGLKNTTWITALAVNVEVAGS
ncbi:hypothetical protein CQW29_18480 [Pantoea coffeiphila]|uniref:Uncharacterized protein n=1 Tax=Pantoea coffeiphila TaxID=1465635 RepID=A0A2S9I869_9GAMM|nr:hypothetical protein CQW29_18480 [Pantoea coffeiphila]